MNIYKILKLVAGNRVPKRLKIAGAWLMYVTGRRMIGLFVDPADACNLNCKMCILSNPENRKTHYGLMTPERIDAIERAFFHRALKLQIGCGTEPTLYQDLEGLIQRGKKAGIPYISITTNGQLIAEGKHDLEALCRAGLNELTLSLHGTRKETYEDLMIGAKYSNLITLSEIIGEVKKKFPDFKLRINYTINSLNVHDLSDNSFWDLFKGFTPDIVQLRPVQDMGDTLWTDFDLSPLREHYDDTIGKIIRECKERGVICLAPAKEQLDLVDDIQESGSSAIEDLTYVPVQPRFMYQDDFDAENDTYESYHRRHHTARRLFASIFKPSWKSRHRDVSKKLNYNVRS